MRVTLRGRRRIKTPTRGSLSSRANKWLRVSLLRIMLVNSRGRVKADIKSPRRLNSRKTVAWRKDVFAKNIASPWSLSIAINWDGKRLLWGTATGVSWGNLQSWKLPLLSFSGLGVTRANHFPLGAKLQANLLTCQEPKGLGATEWVGWSVEKSY
jgi:hypothetical protein